MITEYIINSSTLFLIRDNDECATISYEINDVLGICKDAKEIISDSCEFYGSSYSARLSFSKNNSKTKSKYPILIEESKRIIFFPTWSLNNKTCMWLSYNNIKKVLKKGTGTRIIFSNNGFVDVDTSVKIFDRQLLICADLEQLLISRQKML